MESIISKGKTVEEAIMMGLEELKVNHEDVHIEVLRNDNRGFMGLGSKKAIVKLSTINDEDSQTFVPNDTSGFQEQIIENDEIQHEIGQLHNEQEIVKTLSPTEIKSGLEGKVWVKDGKLLCKSSSNGFPTVTIGDGIKLTRDGEIVQESNIVLSENALYEIRTMDEEKETVWSVSVDDQKLKVVLKIDPGYKITRHISDIEPNSHIELFAEEIKQVDNTLSYEAVTKKLEELRVKYGFNQAQIVKAMNAIEPSEFEIATGLMAKDGKDGWVELLVDTDTKQGLKEDESGKVNFREITTIPTVEGGQVIAIIHPPVPGMPGRTITNEPLPPKQTLPVEVKLGDGTMIVDDKIVASESGRPKVEQRGRIVSATILPKMIHQADVDLKSGNIRFFGDIEILGDVKEHMHVEAYGDIHVHSMVNFAMVTTKGSIIVDRNVVGSELSAGKNNMLVAEGGQLLEALQHDIEQLNATLRNLAQTPAIKQTEIIQKGLQPLIKLLLEKKFKGIIPLSKQYVEVVLKGKEYFDSDVWHEVATTLNQIFLSLSREIVTLEKMDRLTEKMRMLHEWSKTPVEKESYITISSALNSNIYSSGNISVIGNGSMNAKIHAGGVLKVTGIVRGGELFGEEGIEINEVGSEMGTPTVLTVPNDQTIKIKKALEGTIIKIGNGKYTFNAIGYDVNAYLNHDNKIVLK